MAVPFVALRTTSPMEDRSAHHATDHRPCLSVLVYLIYVVKVLIFVAKPNIIEIDTWRKSFVSGDLVPLYRERGTSLARDLYRHTIGLALPYYK